jgi:quinolinate synthase
VSRLAEEQKANDKTVFCLDPIVCPCSTMYRISPPFLLWVMENAARGTVVNQIKVAPEIAANARLSLNQMLAIAG